MISAREQWRGFYRTFRIVEKSQGVDGHTALIEALWGSNKLFTWLRVCMDGDSQLAPEGHQERVRDSLKISLLREQFQAAIRTGCEAWKADIRQRIQKFQERKYVIPFPGLQQ